MKKRSTGYSLTQSYAISREGISIFKVVRDQDSFSYDLLEKYGRDVRELLYSKLDRLVLDHKVPQKDVQRIKELIIELEQVAETKC